MLNQQTQWESCDLSEVREKLPNSSAVYALVAKGQLVYIGSTRNLFRRLYHYCHDHPIRILCVSNDRIGNESTKQQLSRVYGLKIFWANHAGNRKELYALQCSLIKAWSPLLNKVTSPRCSYYDNNQPLLEAFIASRHLSCNDSTLLTKTD